MAGHATVWSMSTLTVLSPDAVSTAEATIVDGRVLVAPDVVASTLGWELKAEGLCRDDVCIPVRDDAGVRCGDSVDLAAAAAAVGSSVLVDDEASVMAISISSDRRRNALKGRQAGDFTLPDLDGTLHSLEDFKDRKRLLVAFASW
jgi:hypothetical protein